MATNSPDLTPYLDLRIMDKGPYEIYETAVQDLQNKMPDWTPREDNTEVMLLESLALEVAESIFAINRLPNAIVVILMKLYGITRDEGNPPNTSVTVTVVDSFGYTIPAGTRFILNVDGSEEPIIFSTNEALLIPDGSTSGTVNVTGNLYTDIANGIIAGTSVELVESITYVETAVLGSVVSNGRSPETDLEWLTRGSQRLRRLSDTLVTPIHFEAAALELTNVSRAKATDLYDPAVGPDPGDNPGHITLTVYGNGAPLSDPDKVIIENDFEDRAIANLDVHVEDPTITEVDVTVSVKIFDGYVFADVQDAIEEALDEYLSPEQWPWAGTVRRNELIALISNVPGVDYVATLTAPASDTALTGVAPLTDLGTATVTQV